MKICWDMIEGIKIGERNGHLRKGHYTYVEMEACVQCGEPYLMNLYKPSEYCCITCGKLGSGYTHNKETRKKIGLASIGNTNMLGKHHTEETKKSISKIISSRVGPLSTRWEGGKSFEPYCLDWTKEYKEYIKERDGKNCLNPDCWSTGNFLTVHHIDYDKKNCSHKNLITICNSCNSRANTNRIWHKSWYRAILYKRYGYPY